MCYMVHIWDIYVLHGSFLGHQYATWFIFGTSMCYMVHIWDINVPDIVYIWDIDVLHGSYLGQ